MLKKLFALGMATIMALGMTTAAFAAEPKIENDAIQRTDGYTYWDIKKTGTGRTKNGKWTACLRGRGGRNYEEEISVSYEESIEVGTKAEIRKEIAAALNISVGSVQTITVKTSGVFGGDNADPEARYELRVRPVYDQYSVKGKKYQRLDGKTYEIDSFGYPGDEESAKYVYKFRCPDFDDTYKV